MEPKVPEFGRFAEPSLLILVSLSDGPKHGYAIMQEEQGVVEPMAPIDRRRPYRLTAIGASNLAEQLRGLSKFAKQGLRQLGESQP